MDREQPLECAYTNLVLPSCSDQNAVCVLCSVLQCVYYVQCFAGIVEGGVLGEEQPLERAERNPPHQCTGT